MTLILTTTITVIRHRRDRWSLLIVLSPGERFFLPVDAGRADPDRRFAVQGTEVSELSRTA